MDIFRLCLIAFLGSILTALPPGAALAAEEEDINNGQDITRPLARFDVRYEYQNAPDRGPDDQHIITLRADKPFVLGERWLLGTRFDLPLMITDRASLDNPRGDNRFGLSDVLAQALLIHIHSETFAWAAGAQVVFPTASEDEMGAGAYRAVPTVGMRWTTDHVLKGSWIALAGRWDRSFANVRDAHGTVNELQFAPVVNIPLPNLWFVNLFPSTDIRYNLGDKRAGDAGRWFVPANVMVGKMLGRSIVSSVEVGVPIIDDYRVYDFKVEARLGFFF